MLSVLGVIFAGFLGYNRAPLWMPFVTAVLVLGVAVIDATSAIAPWHTDLPIASLPPSALPLVAFAINIVLMYLVFGGGWAVAACGRVGEARHASRPLSTLSCRTPIAR